MISLSRLLAAERAPDAVVAWRAARGGERAMTWADFRAGVSGLERELRRLPAGRVALYTADAYAFAVGLFACWHAGRVAVCPPNGQPDTLAALADVVIAAVSDGPRSVPGRPLLSPELERGPATELAALSPNAQALELFTSGTTGRGKAVPKAIHQLENEVRMLDAQLGDLVGDAPAFGSASFDISSRSKTTSAVAWNTIPAWNANGDAGPAQETPDIRSIIQKIVNRPGWASGNALVVILTGSGRRTADSFDGVPSSAPLLHVDWTVNPPP